MTMLIDIEKHYTNRLHSLIAETVDTCKIAECEHRETIAMIMAGLWYELAVGANIAQISERHFLICACTAYQAMKEKIKDMEEEMVKNNQRKYKLRGE